MAPKRIPISIRIEDRISKQGGACWLWKGSFTRDGYGVMSVGKQQKRAHRMAYECFVGEIPDGMLVCHTCDVPACVNPDHLFLGTVKDNAVDRQKKGRNAKQNRSNSPLSKITMDQVAELVELRKSGKSLKEIAAIYGISFQTVSQIYLKEVGNGSGN